MVADGGAAGGATTFSVFDAARKVSAGNKSGREKRSAQHAIVAAGERVRQNASSVTEGLGERHVQNEAASFSEALATGNAVCTGNSAQPRALGVVVLHEGLLKMRRREVLRQPLPLGQEPGDQHAQILSARRRR